MILPSRCFFGPMDGHIVCLSGPAPYSLNFVTQVKVKPSKYNLNEANYKSDELIDAVKTIYYRHKFVIYDLFYYVYIPDSYHFTDLEDYIHGVNCLFFVMGELIGQPSRPRIPRFVLTREALDKAVREINVELNKPWFDIVHPDRYFKGA